MMGMVDWLIRGIVNLLRGRSLQTAICLSPTVDLLISRIVNLEKDFLP